jgi:hypothetical protein
VRARVYTTISLTTITLYLGKEMEEDAAVVLYLMSSNSSFVRQKIRSIGSADPELLFKSLFGGAGWLAVAVAVVRIILTVLFAGRITLLTDK